jgi:hypothetical protein
MTSPSQDLARSRAGQTGGMAPKPPREPRNPKMKRPDGTIEPETFRKGEKTNLLSDLVEKMGDVEKKVASGAPMRVLDKNGERIVTPDSEEDEQAIFEKVALFLDPKLRGPVFTFALEERNKFFVGRFPVQNEMLDVQRSSKALGGDVSNGDILVGVVGELLKAIIGWYPLNSPSVQIFRANVNDPAKWPVMKPVEWLETRDPYVMEDEILKLYEAYMKWKIDVQPTRDEIAFYYGRMS